MTSRSSHPRVDIGALKERLLADVDLIVGELMPGIKPQGRYYRFGGIGTQEGGSAWINRVTGAWRDEADARPAGDLLSLWAEWHHAGDNAAALRELARRYGMWPAGRDDATAAPVQAPAKPASAPAPAKEEPKWRPICPVPAEAPDYRTQWGHYARGVPGRHWEYLSQGGQLLGVVCRFDTSTGGKDVQPLSWCEGPGGRREWRYMAFPQPRPLYGLDRLPALDPEAPATVVVVEGEKCADALYELLAPTPVLAWPGGGKAVALADWSALAGFRVICWPDADAQREKLTKAEKDAGADPLSKPLLPLEDQPGMRAMRKVVELVRAHGCEARIVDPGQPGDRPGGWDCADAIAEGWGKAELRAFLARPEPPAPAADSAQASAPLPPAARAGEEGAAAPDQPEPASSRGSEPPPPGDDPPPADEDEDAWRARLIWSRGAVRECVPNVMEVLLHHPRWRGVLGFDEFSQRIVKRRPPPFVTAAGALVADEWTDTDDTRAAAWIALHEGWVPSSAMVAEAVNVAARAQPFHPVLEYLRALTWDGTPRLEHWAIDLLHVEDTPYARLVSRYFLLGMVRRVLEPGCKFDYCLVLEGRQGKRKSTALAILGGPWFSDTELDLSNKDSMSYIRGKWLHEFGEMGSIARAESTRQKSFLSRQVDEFRPTYGRREIRCPRQGVFGGTTNEWGWHKDPTGGRRFWPLEVRDEVNTDGLAAIRDQLFAEAYVAALAGERYWPTAEEQRELFDPEQLSREAPEAYAELLAVWLAEQEKAPVPRAEFTLSEAITEGLKIDAKGITRDIQTRVGMALAKLGCERVEYRTRAVRHWYKRPSRRPASSVDTVAPEDMEGLPI